MSLGGRRVIVSRPDGSERGRMGVEMAAALAHARTERAAACFLPPPVMANEWLFSLTTDEVPILRPGGVARAWLESRWEMKRLTARRRTRAAEASAAFWLEWYRELRRHVADERLPLDFRGRLRGAAQRSFARSAAAAARRSGPGFPRSGLRHAVRVRLPESLAERARAEARQQGVPLPAADGWRPAAEGQQPIVAVDVREPVEGFDATLDALKAKGYVPVPLGLTPLLDVFLLLTSVFLVCDSADAQRMAYLTTTPTLTINATDAFTFYPVRADGVFLMRAAVDLDTGRTLAPAEMLSETFYRNARNYGFLEHAGADVRAAVDEMVDGVRNGWRDTRAQAEYRARVAAAGEALAGRVGHVAKWGPDGSFIGDGRLARVQAERAAGLQP